jgi:hypothetical protein
VTGATGAGYDAAQALNALAGTGTYILVLTDAGDLVMTNTGVANTTVIPANASVGFATGTRVDLVQLGTGQTTVTGATGVTVNPTTHALRTQYSAATMIKTAADTWDVVGDMSGVVGAPGPTGMTGVGWDTHVIASATTTTGATALANITGLVSPANLAQNATYEFEVMLLASVPAGALGFKIGVSGPTGLDVHAITYGTALTGTVTTPVTLNALATATGVFVTAAALTGVVTMRGYGVLGATGAGTFQVQIAKVTSGTGVVYPGSSLRLKRLV